MKMLIYYFTLAIVSQIIFLKAFFPVSEKNQSVTIERPRTLQDIKFNETYHSTALVDKLIFVIIDALRLDFFTPQLTPFLYKTALETGCNFTVHLESPTVTLPRIKSLTTGRVPQFIDVLLNLGAMQTVRDSFLHQAVKKGKKIVFYGDNTWLKVFPKVFLRSEGVHSFFVNDFTEVDNNVTRNINREISRDDWDVMILHYLGLDHIGHVYGPNSKLVPRKLAEMDSVIRILYEKMKEKTVILVTGDHGMKNSGGHGGSSFSETHVPLIVLNEKCLGGFIEQVDIAPSVSVLLGIDIPSGTVGKIIFGFFEYLEINFQNYLLLYNSLILNCVEFQDIIYEARELHYNFLKNGKVDDGLKAKQLYQQYLKRNSEILIKTFTEQDMNLLILCLFFLNFCFLKILNSPNKIIVDLLLMLSVLCCSIFSFKLTIFLMVILILIFIAQIVCKLYKKITCNLNIIFTIPILSYVVALSSSSFIEEEHEIWYFYLSTFFIYSTFSNTKKPLSCFKFLFAAIVFRFLRQTDIWTGISQWFLLDEEHSHLHLLVVISLLLILLCCFLYTKSTIVIFLNALILISIYVYKSFYIKDIFLSRLIWATILLNAIICFYKRKSFIISWLLIVSLLLRENNIVLLPICVFLSKLICSTHKDVFAKTVLHIILGNAFYYCQGHSNSLASVDVSVGYIGLENYVPIVVISQVLCHTYSFPILTQLLLLKNCKSKTENCWLILITMRLLFLIVVDVVTVVHRNHLFIWSVFSPKLLIESCHSAVMFLLFILHFITIKLFERYTTFLFSYTKL